MKLHEIENLLKGIAKKYPKNLVEAQLNDVKRIAFHLDLALKLTNHSLLSSVCDIGGGVGLFSIGLSALGYKRVVLIDDFNDEVSLNGGRAVLNLHRKYKVEIHRRDVSLKGIKDLRGNFDLITTFDSIEHWHRSPKTVLMDVMKKLKGSGYFICGVPNCVNIRKRITTLLGMGHWSSMEDWYEVPNFRGHVREPNINDLRYIANDMKLGNVRIVGRNWLGYNSRHRFIKFLTPFVDTPLRIKPSFCANIYLIGQK